MKLSAKSGATIAAAAAAFVLTGAVSTPQAVAEESVACYGANSCKGTSACKTAKSSCKGQNACKGQGFIQVSGASKDAATAACKEAGGSTEAPKA